MMKEGLMISVDAPLFGNIAFLGSRATQREIHISTSGIRRTISCPLFTDLLNF